MPAFKRIVFKEIGMIAVDDGGRRYFRQPIHFVQGAWPNCRQWVTSCNFSSHQYALLWQMWMGTYGKLEIVLVYFLSCGQYSTNLCSTIALSMFAAGLTLSLLYGGWQSIDHQWWQRTIRKLCNIARKSYFYKRRCSWWYGSWGRIDIIFAGGYEEPVVFVLFNSGPGEFTDPVALQLTPGGKDMSIPLSWLIWTVTVTMI